MSTERHRSRRLWAYAVLAWGLIVHLVRRIFRSGESGLDAFERNYAGDRLLPAMTGFHTHLNKFSGCINCGICDALCPVVGTVPRHAFGGPSQAALFFSRATPIAELATDFLKHTGRCDTCKGCYQVCPTQVPLGEVIALVRRRVSALERATKTSQ